MTDDKLLEYLKRVTAELQRTREQLRELQTRQPEPIAIVGMSCRFPRGADGPDELWRLVAEAATRPGYPADRGWDVAPAPTESGLDRSASGRGGFLADVARFDAAFFGISPREALAMDPQQRLLLESLLGGAGARRHRPAVAEGQPTGVFAGIIGHDYGTLRRPATRTSSGYGSTGTAPRPAPGASPTPSASTARRCPWTPPARRRWSRCTWPRRRCAAASATLALAGGVDDHVDAGGFIDFGRQRGPVRGRPLQAVRRRRRRHRLVRGRRHAGGGEAVRRRRNGHRVLAVVRGTRRQPGRRVQRADRAERPVAGAGDPGRARRRATVPARHRRRRGARHRHHARRPDRGAGAARHLRRGPAGGPAAVARLDQVQHRPRAGRGGRRRRDQDGAGDAARRAAQDAARRRAHPRRGLVGRWRAAAHRGARVAAGRRTAPRGRSPRSA